ncbi:MAG: hypothetical protein ABI675_31205 [Chitinophagaceae bacterium]
MEITTKIFEWITILKKRPEMVIGEKIVDYTILKIYIEGYVDGIGHALKIDIRKKITLWFQEKINHKSSTYWTEHIRYYYKNKTDEELKVILLDTTEEYFRDNPDWSNIE